LALFTQSYYSIFAKKQIQWDKKGLANKPPRSLGSGAAALMNKIDGSHHDVELSPNEQRAIRFWIDADAHFAGTCAWNGNGNREQMTAYAPDLLPFRCWSKGVRRNQGKTPYKPSTVVEALERRCARCHRRGGVTALWSRGTGRFSPAQMFNLTRPEKSKVLLAPLARSAGGWDVCKPVLEGGSRGAPPKVDAAAPPVWAGPSDPDYRAILAALRAIKERVDKATMVEMPNYRPDAEYVREMKRYGILPSAFDLTRDPIDVFDVDRRYWRSFWP
jgi:hypothetical protein